MTSTIGSNPFLCLRTSDQCGENRPHRGLFLLALAMITGLLTVLAPRPLHAQVATADVLGTVTDPSGAVVPGAQITALDLSTGIRTVAKTTSDGEYVLSHLQVGTYKVTVEAKGFKTFVLKQLTLNDNDRARVDANLQVGSQVETVQIDASAAPELKTDTSTLDTTITSTAVTDMPLDGRNIQNLVQLSAGVTEGAANAPGGAQGIGGHADDYRPTSVFSANGMNDVYNNQMVDGMDNNERSIGTQVIKPSLDAIDQVVVITNIAPAEYGRSVGGVMNVLTKAGGNSFHGTLYEYDRNDALDSVNWIANSKGELRQNQFGGSLGGPIRKDKIFFFGDYEGMRQINATGAAVGTVPDAAERAVLDNASAGVPTSFVDQITGNTIHITPTALGLNLYKLMPAPSNPTATVNNFTGNTKTTQNWNTYDARIDDHFTNKDLLFGRYSYNHTYTGIGYPFHPITINGMTYDKTAPSNINTDGVGLDWTHTISASLLFEAKAAYNRFQNSADVTSGPNAATNLGFAACSAGTGYCVNSPYGGASEGLPSINLNNYGIPGMGPGLFLGDSAFSPLHNTSQSYQYMGSLIWNRDKHSVKLGAGLIRRQLSRIQSPFARGTFSNFGNVTGSDLGDMVEGLSGGGQEQVELNFPQYRSWEPSAYAQDDWRILHWLTLNLGLRYEVFTPLTDKHGALSNFNEAKGVIESPELKGVYRGSSTGGVITQYTNFSPRLGFAASLAHQFVVRGGFGLTYFDNETGGGTDIALDNVPYEASIIYGNGSNVAAGQAVPGVPITNGYTTCDLANPLTCAINMAAGIQEPVLNPANVADLPPGTEIDAVENKLKSGRVAQYSLEIEKQLGANVVTLGYVGNLERHMPVAPDVNQPTTSGLFGSAGSSPYYTPANTADGQDLTGDAIYETASDATGNYNAMQVTIVRRLSKGLMVNANYTWAKAMDNGSPQGEGGSRPVECVRAGCQMDNGSGTPVTVKGFKQYDYGLSDLSVHHRATAQIAYLIPAGNLTGPVGYIAKNWNISGIWFWSMGLPTSVLECPGGPGCEGDRSGLSHGVYWRPPADSPNQTGNANNGPKKVSKSAHVDWFNTSVFVPQTVGLLGNEKRNSVLSPNAKRLDLSLTKDFPVYEAMKLQFRADAFNAFNQPSFGTPNVSYGTPTFGTVNSMAPTYKPREFQFSLRLSF
jgi:hypothetical protein